MTLDPVHLLHFLTPHICINTLRNSIDMYKILRTAIPLDKASKTLSTSVTRFNFQKTDDKLKLNSVVKEAERVVGYPTSFLSLRWILNDEIANVASHIRKLLSSNHPLLKTAKSLLLRNEQATWGLIVLLVSKMAGLNSKFTELECDRTADILHSQRIIAEVTEMIKTSHLLHKCIINVDKPIDDIKFGNTMSLLCGDYLLSTSFREVACLKNFHVQETISSTLRDLSESQFIGLRDSQYRAIPSKPLPVQNHVDIPPEFGVEPHSVENVIGNMKAEWTLRNILSGASLLGKCCQSSLILANHEPFVQELGYKFGRSLALAMQASEEKDALSEERFSLVSAPVMLHLEHHPSLYTEIEKCLFNVDVDYDLIRKEVLKGPGIDKTVELQREFSESALSILHNFTESESKTALINIVNSL